MRINITKWLMVIGILVLSGLWASTANAQCTDAWVTQAIREVKGRGPSGSGGECNIKRYGNGSWSGYPDLKNKVWSAFAGVIGAYPEDDFGNVPSLSRQIEKCAHTRSRSRT